jgi:4a-hydroxytetrahydrobiopterin dehydratase
MQKMSDAEVAAELARLHGWTVKDGKLHREYKFPDFGRAMQFMHAATPEIEILNHHPEWSNVYNRVTVDLTTHDAGGITRRDFELAAVLEKTAAELL